MSRQLQMCFFKSIYQIRETFETKLKNDCGKIATVDALDAHRD